MIKNLFYYNSILILRIAIIMIAIFTSFYINSFVFNYLGYLFDLPENLYITLFITTYFIAQIITLIFLWATEMNGDLLLTFGVNLASCFVFTLMFLVLRDIPWELQLVFACASIVFFVLYSQMAISTSIRALYIHTFPKLIFITTLIVHVFLRDNHHFLEYTFLLVPLSDLIFFILVQKTYSMAGPNTEIDLVE